MRLLMNRLFLILSTLAAVIGLIFLGWILFTLCAKGLAGLSFDVFTTDLIDGGLRNVIIGQIIMSGVATLIGIPVGILAGVYLQEYGGNSKSTEFLRDLSDVMMSAPSIVVGTFVYAIVVIPTGHTSGWAGVLALFILMVPIIVRTTDDMLKLVPTELREAGMAIGASKYHVTMNIVIRYAKAGILTGILLAFARVVGETAPLIYTSGSSQFWSTDLTSTFPSLTVSIYNLATMPDDEMVQLGWTGAFLLTTMVLIINLLGRYASNKKRS
ncbi:MAG: phosphate ABC transporter, permease protein PstA [Piscirickettsiaceae bacterium]|nr:MAG: phosphate ABC transporter, permease protein PstA [Piscirickettsiaceae bacterium]PCI69515.1 MAG: phosphate ABC transporter, permease protein PstA [Piscirickettsiaceae bacterium]